MCSSDEEKFNANVKMHQESLEKAGHTHKLKYEKQDLSHFNKEQKKRNRQQRQFYFNPPFEMRATTKIEKSIQYQILQR